MNICTLDKEDIYTIHQQAILDFGGRNGVYDYTDDRIESILAQQYPVFDYEKYPTIYDKAAALMYFFVKGHCFVDGNKRVGLGSALVFLKINDIESNMTNKEAETLTLNIAESSYRNTEIDDFIFKISDFIYNKSI